MTIFFDYNKLVNDRAKVIASNEQAYVEDIESVDGTVRKGIYMTERGEVLNEEVPAAISRLQAYIRGGSRRAYNTLNQADDRYETYFDSKDQQGGDYQEKMSNFIEIENGARRIKGEKPLEGKELESFVADYDKFLIPNVTDAQGIFQPALRREDIEALDKVVESTFMSNLGYSRVEAKPRNIKDPKPKTPKEEQVSYDLYETLYDAIKEGDSDILNNRKTPQSKNVRFEVRGDGFIDVYDMTPDPVYKRPVNKGKGKLVSEGKSLTDLVSYFYGTSTSTGGTKPEATYNAERDAFYKANPDKEEIAMMEEQTEEMPADQMASNQDGNFLQRLAKGILGRGNNQNIS